MRVIKPFYSQNKQYKAGDDISSVPAIQIDVLKERGFVADDAIGALTEDAHEAKTVKRGRKPKEV